MTEIAESFTNQTIISDELPQLENLEFATLSQRYAPTHRLVTLLTTVILMLVLTAIIYQPFAPLPSEAVTVFEFILWLVGGIGLIATLYNSFADPKKRYALREQDISYQSGLIFRKTVSQPILRVQHVELKRGPVERKVGLASLQVFSAGGSLHTFEIPGLNIDDAEHIRQFILAHKDINQHG
ncbi:PH domain-containing protein [Thalassotalea sp. ND16A]|uniref:PH domain-containing protein n=1 Tax=Thalassotalea sp. ND16A TaxID=1535422 RepID=UPI000519EE78|nr:PH domain-containing protein [Thalassotalea sp. ND16A]KGJ88053.1 hypothetical protein ND16A_2606 [Thalassotalea sp. ND16A]